MNKNLSILNLMENDLAAALRIILDQTDQNSYKWQSTKANREVMVRELDKSSATVSRYIDKLREKEILLTFPEYQRGTYLINRRLINFA